MRRLFWFSFLLFIVSFAFLQDEGFQCSSFDGSLSDSLYSAPQVLWNYTYPIRGWGESVVELSDGTFFVAGRGVQSGATFDFSRYYLQLTYIGGNGDLLWNQSFGTWDWSYAPAVAMEATNGDILVAGTLIHHVGYMSREYHLLFLRFNRQGSCLLNITFEDYPGELIDAIQLYKGTIVLVQRGTFIWMNEDGEIQSTIEYDTTHTWWDSVIACRDGGFLVIGRDITTYPVSIITIRIGEIGEVLWSQTYSSAEYWEGSCLIESDLCGFLLVLYSWDSFDVRAVRVDDFGYHLWNTTYTTIPRGRMTGITKSFDGDFLVCGFQGGPAYCIRINDDAVLIWKRNWGNSTNDEFLDLITCSNGDNLLIGSTNSLWIMRFTDQPVNSSLYYAMFIGGVLCIIGGVIVLVILARRLEKSKDKSIS